jgi:hypothetical protein
VPTKQQLIKVNNVPPDGFRWVDPLDGFVAHAWSYDAWLDLSKAHFQANNRAIPPTLEADMQDQLCQTLPPDWCNFDDPNRPRVSTSLEWADVLNGLRTFASWITGGAQYVTSEEANRRALICSRCYLNTNVTGCASCHKLVADVTKNRHTKYDFALKACAACKCLLQAKVHFPIETLDRNPTVQELYPSFCWLKKGGENYRG